MHIKFLAHGKGDPHAAVTYLLSSQDHEGRTRAGVRVLRGNPALVGEVAVGMRTLHRYTSGVISWAREDDPTDIEVDEVLNDFERTAFAGLEAQQYCWCAVLHTEGDGSKHVHVLAARAELQSGKAFNIAPPSWQRTFDPLRNYWNHTKGWARPDDPLRARPMQPGRFRLASSAFMRENEALSQEAKELGIHASDLSDVPADDPDPKRWITDCLMKKIYGGEIDHRDDLLKALEEFGALNRVGTDYVSLRLAGRPRPLRLKGSIYGADFDAAALRERIAQPSDVALTRGQPDLPAAEQAHRELEAAIGRRAAYNRKRYPAPTPSPHPTPLPTEGQEDSPALISDRGRHDRTRDAVSQRLAQALRAARNSIQRFVEACVSAFDTTELIDRAGRFAERARATAVEACDSAERASDAAERAIVIAQRGKRQKLNGPRRP